MTTQDELLNSEQHHELDERIREVELSQASISSTVQSINANIGDMKNMFQRFATDSEKINSKAEAISRLERESAGFSIRLEELNRKVILAEHTCKTCSIIKVNDCMTSMSDKINKIELSLDEIKSEKNRANGFWNSITQTIVTIIILYLLYIVATNIKTGGNIIGNPPDIEKSESSLFITNANAGIHNKYTSMKIGRKTDVGKIKINIQ